MQVKLSSAQRVALRLPLGGPDGRGAEAVLTRQLLEELTAALFRRLRMPIDVACWQVSALPFTCLSAAAVFPNFSAFFRLERTFMGRGASVDDESKLVFFRQMAPRYAGMLTIFANSLTRNPT